MTVEAEFAQLLIRMGTERGLDIESILSELAWAPFPSFVDAAAVRNSMLDVVESWWRADLEDRLEQLRRQFLQGAEAVQPPISVAKSESAPSAQPQPAVVAQPKREVAAKTEVAGTRQSAPAMTTIPEPVRDATIQEAAAPPKDPSEALPRDATMIWNTRHG